MGGLGSGGWNRKYDGTVEDAIKLDVKALKQKGVLSERGRCNLVWSLRGVIQLDLVVRNESGRLHLSDAYHTSTEFPDRHRQHIDLTTRAGATGGSFELLTCPCCLKARRHLYLSGDLFICRSCAKLTYRSRRENEHARLFRKWEKLGSKVGVSALDKHWTAPKPKGVHANTFEALKKKIENVEEMIDRRLEDYLNEL